jgi:hypothetical protein
MSVKSEKVKQKLAEAEQASQELVKKNTSKNTVKADMAATRFFNHVSKEIGDNDLPMCWLEDPMTLDNYLQAYISQLYMADGKCLSSCTLNTYFYSISRVVYTMTSGRVDIAGDGKKYYKSHNILRYKKKESKDVGKGEGDGARPISRADVQSLAEKSLGDLNSWHLLATVWFLLTISIGSRTMAEHRSMLWSDFIPIMVAMERVLEFRFRVRKNDTGQSTRSNNYFKTDTRRTGY